MKNGYDFCIGGSVMRMAGSSGAGGHFAGGAMNTACTMVKRWRSLSIAPKRVHNNMAVIFTG